jgi:hypothetical protein
VALLSKNQQNQNFPPGNHWGFPDFLDFLKKSSPHFTQICLFEENFYVYSKKTCKICDFWIDFVRTLPYNRGAKDLTGFEVTKC